MKPERKELKSAVTAGQSAGHWLEKWAALMPWLIVCYFAVQLCVRLVIASPLEVDDAEMVGQIDWALGYPNSHPPLYHWLVRICYDLFHSWPAATAFPKYALLAAAYILIYHAARRASGSVVTGAVAVAFCFFIPVVCWKTQTKLTHSILGFTATAALLHAFICILTRPGWKAFVWLGISVTIGLLAKYNFLLVLLSGVTAALAVGDVRRLFRTRAALLAVVIPVLLTFPHLLWVRAHPRLTTENLYRLQITGGPLGLNLRADSVWDGLISLLLVTATSAVPMFLLCLAATLIFREDHPVQSTESRAARIARQFFGWMVISELLIFIVVVLAGGFSQVHERYLLVLLPPLPLWFALFWRSIDRRKASAAILIVAAALALFITAGTAVARTKAKRAEHTHASEATGFRGVLHPDDTEVSAVGAP